MTNTPLRTSLPLLAVLALVSGSSVLALPAGEGSESDRFGYIRNAEGGSAVVSKAGERQDAEANLPILVGDRLHVGNDGRLDVVLPDRNWLRVDRSSEVGMVDLAFAPDTTNGVTLLDVPEGNLLLTVVDDALGRERPRIDTPNATVYVHQAGVYRISSAGSDWTQVVVREGVAEVVTRGGAATVRAGEQVVVEGVDSPNLDVRAADLQDGLERWARNLDSRLANVPRDGYVDSRLASDAEPLYRHGAWISVEGGRRAWRPTVGSGWRPYHRGRWLHTTSGICWVSYEPWGWLTYHYGSWDYQPGWGWVWHPGSTWAPAWVYWYWGQDWVGWVPVGYYTRFYGSRYGWNRPWHFGVHGWAGGHGWYDRWCFSRGRDLGDRRLADRVVSGLDLANRNERLATGLIVTDTRDLDPRTWNQPGIAIEALRSKPGVGDLPDITSFVGRKPLPANVEQVVLDNTGTNRPTFSKPFPGGIGDRARDGVVDRGGKPALIPGGGVAKPGLPTTVAKPGQPSSPANAGDGRGRVVLDGGGGGGRASDGDWRRGGGTIAKPAPGAPSTADGKPVGGTVAKPSPSAPPSSDGKPGGGDWRRGTVSVDGSKPAGDGSRGVTISKPAPGAPVTGGSGGSSDWRRPGAKPAPVAPPSGSTAPASEAPPETDSSTSRDDGRRQVVAKPAAGTGNNEEWRARSGSPARHPTIYLGRTPDSSPATGSTDRPPAARRVVESVRANPPAPSRDPSAPPSTYSKPASSYGKPAPVYGKPAGKPDSGSGSGSSRGGRVIIAPPPPSNSGGSSTTTPPTTQNSGSGKPAGASSSSRDSGSRDSGRDSGGSKRDDGNKQQRDRG